MNLEQANYPYRNPAVYDEFRNDPDHIVAGFCEQLIDAYGPDDARSLLDFGCGTGADLEHLAKRFDGVGVDVQPGMIGYARCARPALDFRVGDLRSFRLGRTVDIITCLGLALAYLRDNADLQKAFTTFAAHAHTGTVLILVVPVAPVEAGESRSFRVDVGNLHARVTVDYEWQLRTQTSIMHRRWAFDDGAEAQDCIRRRVIFPLELEMYLNSAGFDLVDIANDPTTDELTGPAAYAMARFTEGKQPHGQKPIG